MCCCPNRTSYRSNRIASGGIILATEAAPIGKKDLKAIKDALLDLSISEPYLQLLRDAGLDVTQIEGLREDAKRNLLAYQTFIEQQ
jgi:hypothetical protein